MVAAKVLCPTSSGLPAPMAPAIASSRVVPSSLRRSRCVRRVVAVVACFTGPSDRFAPSLDTSQEPAGVHAAPGIELLLHPPR